MTNEVIEGNEWVAYGALDTYSQDETRDRLPAERRTATEPPLELTRFWGVPKCGDSGGEFHQK
jgi:hypothetical protein